MTSIEALFSRSFASGLRLVIFAILGFMSLPLQAAPKAPVCPAVCSYKFNGLVCFTGTVLNVCSNRAYIAIDKSKYVGPKGDMGPAGPRGEKGVAGAIGPKGDKGTDGAIGLKGDKGAAGTIGPKGADGAIGPKGEMGVAGAMGLIGPRGLQGSGCILGTAYFNSLTNVRERSLICGTQLTLIADGANGVHGADGAPGTPGSNGIPGSAGESCKIGVKYFNSEEGATGRDLTCGASVSFISDGTNSLVISEAIASGDSSICSGKGATRFTSCSDADRNMRCESSEGPAVSIVCNAGTPPAVIVVSRQATSEECSEGGTVTTICEDTWPASPDGQCTKFHDSQFFSTVECGGSPPTNEQTEFTVILKDAGFSKLGVVKAVKDITGLGLKEAKDLVDSAPKPVKEGISKAEAEAIKKILEEAGASVEIK